MTFDPMVHDSYFAPTVLNQPHFEIVEAAEVDGQANQDEDG